MNRKKCGVNETNRQEINFNVDSGAEGGRICCATFLCVSQESIYNDALSVLHFRHKNLM